MPLLTETRLPIRLEALDAAALVTEPFRFAYVPGFLGEDVRARVYDDFPLIDKAGSFPIDVVPHGPAFAALVAALEAPEMRRAVERKFGLSLTGRPTMVTVRGMGRASPRSSRRCSTATSVGSTLADGCVCCAAPTTSRTTCSRSRRSPAT